MKKNIKKILILFSCCSLLATGCGSENMVDNESVAIKGAYDANSDVISSTYDSNTIENSGESFDETTNINANKTNNQNDKIKKTKNGEEKLVYNYNVSFTSFEDDSKKINDNINNAVDETKGFIESSSYSEYYYSLTIKVPTENRDKFLDMLTKDVTYDNYTIDKNVENKTSEYNDLEKSYEIAKENYNAYSKILNRAETIDDVLKVTNYVNESKSQMDYYKGLMNGIDKDVLYSTINISISFRKIMSTLDKDLSFSSELFISFKEGINSFIENLQYLIIAIVGHIIPICVIIIISIFIIKYKKKHPKNKIRKNIKNLTKEENKKDV